LKKEVRGADLQAEACFYFGKEITHYSCMSTKSENEFAKESSSYGLTRKVCFCFFFAL